jgi:hypothetical protein
MINGIKTIFVILTSDNSNTYCLSFDPINIILPILEIESIEYLHDELRYRIRNFFDPSSFEFNEECDLSILSLQNKLSIDYIKSIDTTYDATNTLNILCGGVITKNKTKKSFHWNKLQYDTDLNGFTNNTNLNLLIDNVINKTII